MPSNEPTPMGISFITLGVSDVLASRRFYEAIGFRPDPKSRESVTFFDLSGLVFALYPRDSLAQDAATTAGDLNGIVSSLSHNVRSESEVYDLLERARNAGGRILRTPSPPPWGGVRGYFADPDGFAWEIAWNPHVELMDDGRVRWRQS